MSDHNRQSALHPHEVRRMTNAKPMAIANDEPAYRAGDVPIHHARGTVDDARRVLALRIAARPEARRGKRSLVRRALSNHLLRKAMAAAGTRRQRRAAAKADGLARRAVS